MEQHNKKQKTPLFRFFELWFQNFWLLFPINFLYSLISAPLLPAGLAQAGITNVTRNIARDKHSYGISDFFDTVKANWKQSLLVGIVNTVVTLLLCYGLLFYYNSQGIIADIALGFLMICFVVFSFMRYYIWVMVITFDLPTSKIYKNSFLLAFVNFKTNLLVGVIELAIYAALVMLVISIPHFIVLFLAVAFAVFILPGFLHLLIQFSIFPGVKKYMIDPYYESHPQEDLSLRRSLRLDADVPSDETTDPIFHD